MISVRIIFSSTNKRRFEAGWCFKKHDVAKKCKVLKALIESHYDIKPKQKHYTRFEVDELWTFVGSKANRKWLIYAYDRDSGEIVAYVWGDRSAKTANHLREKIIALGVTYDRIATGDWESFIKTFSVDAHDVGKQHSVGIDGNNCRLRHCMRRIFVNHATSLKSYAITTKPSK